MKLKLGNIELENDTLEVIVFATVATTVIVLFTGAGALANLWNKQARPNLPEVHYTHDSFAAHGGDHGGDHGGEHAAPAEHGAPAAH